MNNRLQQLLLSLALAFSMPGQASEIMPNQREISGPNILLENLYLSPLTASSPKIPKITLGPSPGLNETRNIAFEEASTQISNYGFTPEAFGWKTNQVLILSRKTKIIDKTELLDHLSIALIEATPNLDGDLEIELIRDPGEIRITDEPFELRLVDSLFNGIKSRFIVPFEILVSGEVVYKASAALQAKIVKEIWLSSRRLNRGEALDESSFYLARKDILLINGSPLDASDSMSGLESRSTILQDRPILNRYTARIPVVKRGDLVDAVLKKGILSITMKVYIMDQGAPGDTIRVRNPKSKKQLKGVVSDDSTIRIL